MRAWAVRSVKVNAFDARPLRMAAHLLRARRVVTRIVLFLFFVSHVGICPRVLVAAVEMTVHSQCNLVCVE